MVDESLRNYIETNILPLYDYFDAAHQRNHVDMVIEQSMAIVADLDADIDMVYTIAAYHVLKEATSVFGLRTAPMWRVSTPCAKS